MVTASQFKKRLDESNPIVEYTSNQDMESFISSMKSGLVLVCYNGWLTWISPVRAKKIKEWTECK